MAEVVTQAGSSVPLGRVVARDWQTFCHLGSGSAGTLSPNLAQNLAQERLLRLCVGVKHASSLSLFLSVVEELTGLLGVRSSPLCLQREKQDRPFWLCVGGG